MLWDIKKFENALYKQSQNNEKFILYNMSNWQTHYHF